MKKPGTASLWAILAFAAAFAAYSPTLRLDFVWDNHRMIEENHLIRTWSAENVRSWFRGDLTTTARFGPSPTPLISVSGG